MLMSPSEGAVHSAQNTPRQMFQMFATSTKNLPLQTFWAKPPEQRGNEASHPQPPTQACSQERVCVAKALGTVLALRMAVNLGSVPPPGLDSGNLLPTPTGVLLDPPVLPPMSAWAQLLEVAAGPWHLVLPGEGRRPGRIPRGGPVHRGSQPPPFQGAKGA